LPGGSELDEKVSRQVENAVKTAQLVLFIVDGSSGLTDDDAMVANKADNDRRENERWEFLSLGLGDPYPVSALHGRRAGDLLDEVIARIPHVGSIDRPREYDDDSAPLTALVEGPKPPRVAIVGRPNVGKSTLFNRLVGEDRSVVHDMPGTTRDAIDTMVDTEDGPIVYVDTAGMRKKSRIDDSAEYYSLVRALRAVDESDIALLVIDATEGVTAQDQRLAERIDAAGCPILVLLNKWELVDDAEVRADITEQIADKLHFVGDAPVLKISALTGKGVHKLRPVLQDAIERYHKRVPTRDVNKVIAAAQQRQPAPHGLRVMYALQGATDPPTFTLFANRELPPTYLRYLERSIREAFDFGSVPIKLRVRRRSE
jgi:GTP-binding protein